MSMKLNEEPLQKAWNSAIQSPYADVGLTLLGGLVGGFSGWLAGVLLAQVFFLALILLRVPSSFNGLAWAIYIGLAAIWIGVAIGCWNFLRDKFEGATLTACLSAVTVAVVFYLVSIRVVVHSDSIALLLLALAVPLGRIIFRALLSLRRLWNTRATQ